MTNRCEKVKSQVLQKHYESGKWGRETKIGGEVSEGRWRNNMRRKGQCVEEWRRQEVEERRGGEAQEAYRCAGLRLQVRVGHGRRGGTQY